MRGKKGGGERTGREKDKLGCLGGGRVSLVTCVLHACYLEYNYLKFVLLLQPLGLMQFLKSDEEVMLPHLIAFFTCHV